MSVSIAEVRRIAWLARLELAEEALGRYAADLRQVLDHMEVLQSLAVDGPPSQSDAAELGQARPPLRDDGGEPIPLARTLADVAPLTRDGFILVPRLATHEQAGE
jgi:aspartyl-tRNA(Asn)/glutamyl-tRNA(Gln) amidotransferase subunit C